METNQTEILENAEDKAMQEADAVKSEKLTAHIERTDRKTAIPLAFVNYLAAHAEKYQESAGFGSLTTESDAAKHPDVRQLHKDFPSMSLGAATRIAWLLWRARQVEFWTTNLDKDRVVVHDNGFTTTKRGTPRHTWAECLDAAYLGKNSEIHNLAMGRRERFYEVQNQTRDELETLALTVGQQATAADRPSFTSDAQKQANVQADAKVEQEMADTLEAARTGVIRRRPNRK